MFADPGPSSQSGPKSVGSDEGGQKKPSDKAAGLRNSSALGSELSGPKDTTQAGPYQMLGCSSGAMKAGPDELTSDDVTKASPNPYGLQSDPVLIENTGPKIGSGYFDVSNQNFGLGPKQVVNTKNSFGSLCDEVECFDTELGLWENEIEVVIKFVESNTRPKLEDYDSWSTNMKKYYDGLTKMNEDDEVASETDETARFMKSGVKA
ncbi:hypothetical protein Hdeb2414_s0005g00158741 [Helianthus debilis subsp. tardiflorus]